MWYLLFLIQESLPVDSGPVYKETLAGRFPVEPFNTFSNFLFLGVCIYFALRVYRRGSRQVFLAFCLPVLLLGFIGGTVYHATRSAEIWLYLDWVPIVTLCLACSFYFAWKAGKLLWQKIVLCALVLGLPLIFRSIPWPQNMQISLGYIGTALGVLLPIVLYAARTRFTHFYGVVAAVLSFGIAISFRIFDSSLAILPMGTHWLWHSFGAVAVFFIMNYVYKDQTTINESSTENL